MANRHADVTIADGRHPLVMFQYANEANRIAHTPSAQPTGHGGTLLPQHVGCLVHQTDTDDFYLLLDDSPITWSLAITTGGGAADLIVLKSTAGTINIGEAVYLVGHNAGTPTVELARGNSATTMPSVGVCVGAITDAVPGIVRMIGTISPVDTSAFSNGDDLWVSTTVAGGFQNTKPTGSANKIQKIGQVVEAGASGSIFALGAGRTNDLPALASGRFWLGNGTDVATESRITDLVSATVAATDEFMLGDTSDGAALKKGTVQGILDLAGGGTHALGGASHTADTLANVNTKISDANIAARPASAADNSVPRHDGDETALQSSGVLIDDGDCVTGVTCLEIDHTAVESDDHALVIRVDAAGFSDVKAVDIAYTTGAIGVSVDEECVLVNIDESASTGGRVVGLEVIATAEGSAEIDAIEVGVGVHPIKQLSGVFGNLESLLVIAVNQLTALSSGGAGNISVFVADNDSMTFGDSEKFEELAFIFDTVASNPGIAPTFEYSTGVGTWATFGPSDGTNAFRNNGVVAWLDSDIPSWAIGTGSEFLIRITRTRNSLGTTPILDLVQRAVAALCYWDKDGCLLVKCIDASVHFTDPVDATKEAILDLSAITTATLRTIAVPDRDLTLGSYDAITSIPAEKMKSSLNANMAVNGNAPLATDTNDAGLKVRLFDDTTEGGPYFYIDVPDVGVTNMQMFTRGRAEAGPGGAVVVKLLAYFREVVDGAAVGSWGSAEVLTDVDLPVTTEFFHKDETDQTIAAWGLTKGRRYQVQVTRTATGDTLSGDFALSDIRVEYTP
jgi:hypothetical protein